MRVEKSQQRLSWLPQSKTFILSAFANPALYNQRSENKYLGHLAKSWWSQTRTLLALSCRVFITNQQQKGQSWRNETIVLPTGFVGSSYLFYILFFWIASDSLDIFAGSAESVTFQLFLIGQLVLLICCAFLITSWIIFPFFHHF